MPRRMRWFMLLMLPLAAVVLPWWVSRSPAYVEAPMSFGAIVAQSSNIVLMRVEMVDRDKNLIVYRKVQDIKGKHPTELIKHNIGRGGLRANEWKPQMDWAEPGKLACFFYNGGASETCIGTWWYQAYAGGEWWNHSHGEPFLLRSYAGPPERLVSIVTDMMAGKEVTVPCMIDGNKEDLHNRKAKMQRLKVSLKLQDYNQKRDFVGWGGEDFRRINSMPGFTHITSLSRVDPEAQAISTVDVDGDGKPDLCLVGAGRVVVLQNGGEALSELSLPTRLGARSAVWADYNRDGKPDLLLATPQGPKLFTNLGGGQLRDDSHLLPSEAAYNLTAAAWIDYDGDGLPDILLANGYHGLLLYRNNGSITVPKAPAPPKLGAWQYLGPLDNTRGQAFDETHPVEKAVDLKAEYKGREGEPIRWQEGKFNDGQINDLRRFKPQFNVQSAVYLYREIDCDGPTDLPISLGSDDTLTVWVNGVKVLAENVYRAAAPDQNRLTLKLREGKNQLLMKVCQGDGEWSFFFAAGKPETAPPRGQGFTDVSALVGLGPDGVAAGKKGDTLTVADVNGDGRPDFLYGAGTGILALARGDGKTVTFAEARDSGIRYAPGHVGPVFADFDNDGAPDLFVPQKGGSKLFKNNGKGQFTDVTETAGDLAAFKDWATSAAWGDFDNDGRLDLLVGCLRSPNRFFRNKGDGTFEDATDKVGLDQQIFNSQAVSLVDLNGDGYLDAIFNNEGQDSVVLLGSNALAGKRIPVTFNVTSKVGVVGSRVQVADKAGKLIAAQEISGGDGRGGQHAPIARFALEPGTYRLTIRFSNGRSHTRELLVGNTPLRSKIDEEPAGAD